MDADLMKKVLQAAGTKTSVLTEESTVDDILAAKKEMVETLMVTSPDLQNKLDGADIYRTRQHEERNLGGDGRQLQLRPRRKHGLQVLGWRRALS